MKNSVTPPPKRTQNEWLNDVGDPPDHYHGFTWNGGVMPNNHMFFLRQSPEEMSPERVTHCIHHRYEMVIPYAGSGYVCVEDKIYQLSPGHALLLTPGTFHHYFNMPKKGFSWLFFTFDLDADLGQKNTAGAPRKLSEEDLLRISEAGELYVNPGMNESLMFEIGLRMGRTVQGLHKKSTVSPLTEIQDADRETCDLLRALTKLVDRDMDKALRIDDLAKHMGISESYLRKNFRDYFGISLGRYLRNSRLTRCVQLIHLDEMSISEIGKLCGFESVFSFSQSFNRAMGMSPTAYRQHLLNRRPPIKRALKSKKPSPTK